MANREEPPRLIYWDACIFIALIEGIEDQLPVIEAVLDGHRANKVRIVTSMLSIAEVAFIEQERTSNQLDPGVEEKIGALWDASSPFELVEVHQLVIQDAQRLMRDGVQAGTSGLKPADAIHLASAVRLGVDEMHTYDNGLLNTYCALVPFVVRKPAVDRLPLSGELEMG